MANEWKELQDAFGLSRWDVSPIDYTFLQFLPNYYLDGSDYAAWYKDVVDENNGFTSFSTKQQLATYFILEGASSSKIAGDYANYLSYRVSFSDITNLTFNEEIQNGDDVGAVTFLNVSLTAPNLDGVTRLPVSLGSGGEVNDKGDVLIDQDSGTNIDSSIDYGEVGFWLLLHELGHGIGDFEDLKDTNLLDTEFDSQKYTMMSYNPHGGAYATGLQLFDIAALQEIYGGRNYQTRSDNTTYSSATAFASTRPNGAFIYTIWDGDGEDTISAAGYTTGAKIDLRQGEFSSIGLDASGDAVFEMTEGNDGVFTIDRDIGNVAIAYTR